MPSNRMELTETSLEGVWVVEPEVLGDERGWFARTFDAEQFATAGLEITVVQANSSFNAKSGTVRGMHYQAAPFGEAKLISCVRGAIYDVALDLRRSSPSFGQWHAAELSASNRKALFIPPGLAHGYQTLCDECEIEYLMGHEYVPEAGRGVRWDDPGFSIEWPSEPAHGRTIVAKDLDYPDFTF